LYSFTFHVGRTRVLSNTCMVAGQLDNLPQIPVRHVPLVLKPPISPSSLSFHLFSSPLSLQVQPPVSPTTIHPSRTQPIPWSKEVMIGLENTKFKVKYTKGHPSVETGHTAYKVLIRYLLLATNQFKQCLMRNYRDVSAEIMCFAPFRNANIKADILVSKHKPIKTYGREELKFYTF